jgi:CubicO group peptidase (beta-lactamase class C family)/AcrR family transcriptional regulator
MAKQLPSHLTEATIREAILDTAEQLLSTKGFREFTMEELAERVGIAKGTSYLYFTNKESIALGVIARSVGRVLDALMHIAMRTEPASGRLRRMIVARVMLRHENVSHYDQMKLAELLSILRDGLRDRRKKYCVREISVFAKVIEEGVLDGEFTPCNAEALATAIFWASEGMLPSYVAADELSSDAIASRIGAVARLLVAGLQRGKTSAKHSNTETHGSVNRNALRMLGVSAMCGSMLFAEPAKAQIPGTTTTLPTFSARKVDSIFAKFASDTTPGCAVGVDTTGQSIIRSAYGMASLELNVPNSTQTVYYGASLAKQFTAAAIILLEHDGRIRLSDRIRKYLPELPAIDSSITLQHLLEHTSGLRDYPDLLLMSGAYDSDDIDFPGVLRLLERQRSLNFASGSQFAYNNGGYALLAEIVARVTGAPFSEFTKRRIFLPLEMNSTQFTNDHRALLKLRASGYRNSNTAWEIAPYLSDVYGDGGVFTTVGDMLRWAHNLETGKVGGQELIARVSTQTILPDGHATGFGLGLEVGRYRGHDFLGHGGRSSGAQNYAMTFPKEKVSIVALCNARDIDAELYVRRIAGSIFPPVPPQMSQVAPGSAPVDTSSMRAVTGIYFNPTTLGIRKVELRDGNLIWVSGGGSILRPQSNTRYRFPDQPGSLVFSDFRHGHATRMSIVPDVGDPTPYQLAADFVTPSRGLREFEGVFASDEVGGTFQVTVSENSLVLQSLSSSFSFRAFPVMIDAFNGGGGVLIAFRRDRKNRVTGFDFSTSRARNVLFRKASSLTKDVSLRMSPLRLDSR